MLDGVFGITSDVDRVKKHPWIYQTVRLLRRHKIEASTLADAATEILGDNREAFALAIMHSTVAHTLEAGNAGVLEIYGCKRHRASDEYCVRERFYRDCRRRRADNCRNNRENDVSREIIPRTCWGAGLRQWPPAAWTFRWKPHATRQTAGRIRCIPASGKLSIRTGSASRYPPPVGRKAQPTRSFLRSGMEARV